MNFIYSTRPIHRQKYNSPPPLLGSLKMVVTLLMLIILAFYGKLVLFFGQK